MGNKMKKTNQIYRPFAVIVLILLCYTNISRADSIHNLKPIADKAVLSSVNHYYETITVSEPYDTTECYFKSYPVYSKIGPSIGAQRADVLTGVLLGGLLGKVVTGKDKAAIGGAMIGGIIANTPKKEQQIIIGHTRREVCDNKIKYKWVKREEYQYSNVAFTLRNGQEYILQFHISDTLRAIK